MCQTFDQPGRGWSAGLPPEVQHAEHPRPPQEFELNLPPSTSTSSPSRPASTKEHKRSRFSNAFHLTRQAHAAKIQPVLITHVTTLHRFLRRCAAFCERWSFVLFAMFRLNILFVKICTNVIAHNFQHSEKPLGEAIMVIVPADVVAQRISARTILPRRCPSARGPHIKGRLFAQRTGPSHQ